MDDINFDELDKAVNSVLRQSSPASPLVDAGAAPKTPSSLGTDDLPVASSVQKPRGQFMDMVHPSSDMTPSAPARSVSRQSVVLQPLHPDIVEAVPQPIRGQARSTPPQSEQGVETPEETKPPVENAGTVTQTPHSEWPDPLDVMAKAENRSASTQDTDDDNSDLPEIAHAESGFATAMNGSTDAHPNSALHELAETPESLHEPVQTPFINANDVEKRPLGAFASAGTEKDNTAGISDNAHSARSDTDEDHQGEPLPKVPLPEELAPDVVSVESDNTSITGEEADEESGNNDLVADTGRATSIPQQYKVATGADDGQNEVHPVFDTKEYHQPIAAPPKKGHKALWITLLLIVLTSLGAAAWYAIFVMKLI